MSGKEIVKLKFFLKKTIIFFINIYLIFLLITPSNEEIIITERPEKEEYIKRLNSKIIHTFQTIYEQSQYTLTIKDPILRFNSSSITEEEIQQNYSIIYSNVVIELFFKFDIKPITDDVYFESRLILEDKMGYAKITIPKLILNETSEKVFKYTQEIDSISYSLDDVESFIYFREILDSGINAKFLIKDIWEYHLQQVLIYYPKPEALEMMNVMISLLKYYKEFAILLFKNEIYDVDRVTVLDITFKDFTKKDYFSGTFYIVEFYLEYRNKEHKILYGQADVSKNTFALSDLRRGDEIDDYVCKELAYIALEYYYYA